MGTLQELCHDFLRFNGRHAGKTIFIIGAGPQLARLSPALREALEEQICIGVNWTTYKITPVYFLSAYIHHVLLAQLSAPDAIHMHMRPVYEKAVAPGIIPLKRQRFDGKSLNSQFSPPEPTVATLKNVVFGATHLAHIMGATQIAYVGVEQQDAARYFNYDPEVAARIREDMAKVHSPNVADAEHSYATYERRVGTLATQAEEQEKKPFFSEDHTATFRAYFHILRSRGCRIVSSVEASITVDAGAEYQPLEALLSEG